MQSKSAPAARPDAIDVFGPLVVAQGPYRVIYSDPPWETPNCFTPNGNGSHYPLMDNKDIVDLPVIELADRDCMLCLWTTWSNLWWTERILASWGFKYSTGMPWIKISKSGKPAPGLGGIIRSCSEIVIIGRRGHPKTQGPGRTGVIMAPRAPETRKPDEVADWLTATCEGPYLEMFARRPRPGWVVWGNEVATEVATSGE